MTTDHERVMLMEQEVDRHADILDDHENRIRWGERKMYGFIAGVGLLQALLTVYLHYAK